MSKRALRIGLLLAMLLALVPLKARFDFGLGPRSHDADYYYTIARSVSEGDGLQSNISLYFQGLKILPQRVTQTPLWPLLLGHVGRWFGLEASARRLPEALFFADLVLLYFLALRLRRGVAGERPGWLFREGRVPDFGHVAVFALGTNTVFFRFTSVPNNEALAFGLLFAALLAVDRAARARSAAWAVAAGLLGGLALLARAHVLPVIVAVPAVLAWIGRGDRRGRLLAPAALLGVAIALVPWAVYLASWTVLTPAGVLGLETQRATPELEVLSHSVGAPTAFAYALDRLAGLRVAFDPRSASSYVSHFGPLAWSVPLAALAAAAGWLRRPAAPPRALAPGHALPLAMTLVGGGMLLPVHLLHPAFFSDWLFGFRHGLPLLLLLLPALAWLDARGGRVAGLAAGGLLAAALVTNTLAVHRIAGKHFRSGSTAAERALIGWLDAQSPRPAAITTKPWELGAFSRSGYHWILCRHSPQQTLTLLHETSAEYVIAYQKDMRCNFVKPLLDGKLEFVRGFGSGKGRIYVFALAGTARSTLPGKAAERPRAGTR